MTAPLLSVRDLSMSFAVRRSAGERVRRAPAPRLVAVDGVSFDLERGATLGIVGESGSGKSTLARCLVRLYRPDRGAILFDGVDVARLEGAPLRAVRRRVQMVFQDPFTSLNPFLSVGDAIGEAGLVHGRTSRAAAPAFVRELLDLVGLPSVDAGRRPRELSGGQRQRVAIARALAVGPEVLIADEAVSSLDVSIQAQILALFAELQRELDLTVVFISHQLAVIAQVATRAAVMYLGRVVEEGPTAEVFARPQHPYTKGLLDSHPEPDPRVTRPVPAVRGELPSPLAIPSGCRFRTRCAWAQPACSEVDPPLEPAGDGRLAACPVRPFAAGQAVEGAPAAAVRAQKSV